jgi:hypothetical protein
MVDWIAIGEDHCPLEDEIIVIVIYTGKHVVLWVLPFCARCIARRAARLPA